MKTYKFIVGNLTEKQAKELDTFFQNVTVYASYIEEETEDD